MYILCTNAQLSLGIEKSSHELQHQTAFPNALIFVYEVSPLQSTLSVKIRRQKTRSKML